MAEAVDGRKGLRGRDDSWTPPPPGEMVGMVLGLLGKRLKHGREGTGLGGFIRRRMGGVPLFT